MNVTYFISNKSTRFRQTLESQILSIFYHICQRDEDCVSGNYSKILTDKTGDVKESSLCLDQLFPVLFLDVTYSGDVQLQYSTPVTNRPVHSYSLGRTLDSWSLGPTIHTQSSSVGLYITFTNPRPFASRRSVTTHQTRNSEDCSPRL